MTSKTEQKNKKVPISIYFSDEQIPKYFSKLPFDDYISYSIYRSEDKILLNLKKITHLNILQKNYKLLLIASALRNYCKAGYYFIEYFGCKETDLKNFLLGWELASYRFERFKSKKKKKDKVIITHKHNTEISYLKSSYFFIRDLINMPPNMLGPKEILEYSKKFLTKFKIENLVSGNKLKKNFPLIHAVGNGSDIANRPLFCELILKKKKKKREKFF